MEKNNLEETKAESKASMGRLRDEEQMQADLTQKQAALEVEVQQLTNEETALKGESKHLESMQAQSKERQTHLNEEKKCVEELVARLTEQNRAILEELESHTYAHEVVRTHLDRREEVSHMMNAFNRDLVESKMSLERYSSPLRQSPYKVSAAHAASYMVRQNGAGGGGGNVAATIGSSMKYAPNSTAGYRSSAHQH